MIGQVALKKPAVLLALGQYRSEGYQRVLDYAISQGLTLPSVANQALQKTLVDSLKAAGIWDKLDVFYNFFTDAPRPFAKLNWKRPEIYPAVEGGTLAYAPKVGFNNTGPLGYLSTIAPSECTQMLSSSGSHIWGYVLVGSAAEHHGFLGPGSEGILKYWGGTYLNGGPGVATGSASGFHHSDFSGGTLRLHRNGVLVGSQAYITSSKLAFKVWVCQRNDSGVPGNTDASNIFTCFALGGSLVGLEMAFYNAWNTYRTATAALP